jgi:hypothetical protein
MEVDLTYKMLSYQAINNFDSDECIDWAVQMLCNGFETPSLEILAGLDKPANYFETIQLLEKTFNELGMLNLGLKNTIIPYSYYLISKIANGEDIRENLKELKKLSVESEYEKIIFDFYLLYWAWDDLDYGDSNHYWEGATKENISGIAIKTAQEWIEKNKIEVL